MKENLMKIFLLALILMPFLSRSQTKTFDYTSQSWDNDCNVFNLPTGNVTIDGVVHLTHAGGVGQSSSNPKVLQLSVIPSTQGTAAGTAFRIDYGFVPGYSYTIKITASGNSAVYLRTAAIQSFGSNFPTDVANADETCTPDTKVPDYTYNVQGPGRLSTVTGNSQEYAIPAFTVPSSYPYFLVWAAGGRTNLSLDVLSISKIEIIKTASAPSFTLPSTTNIPCGSISPVTFTATTASNPNNATITDYTWNLGATPNGWKLPNGSAAPATYSTGTTNSITLTPDCGQTLSSVNATVTAGGTAYNTNTSTINITAPSLSINGGSTICSGSENYTVANLPCNASVVWSLNPSSGVASSSCTSCSSTTLSQTGSGVVTLTATVSNLCSGGPVIISKDIAFGEPNFQFQVFPSYSPDCYMPYEYYDFYIQPTAAQQHAITRYIWGYRDFSTSTTYITQPDGTPAEAFFFPHTGSFEIFFKPDNECGSGPESTFFVYVEESCDEFRFNASVFPNPAGNDVFVTITNPSKKIKALPASAEVTMVLYEVNSKQKIRQWKFKHDRNRYQINVRGLRKGVYTLVITVGKHTTSKQLLITK